MDYNDEYNLSKTIAEMKDRVRYFFYATDTWVLSNNFSLFLGYFLIAEVKYHVGNK